VGRNEQLKDTLFRQTTPEDLTASTVPVARHHAWRRRSLGQTRYTLGPRVSVREHEQQGVLVMSYPLKAMRVSKALLPLFRYLESQGECHLDDLLGLFPGPGKHALEDFLNRLEKKGWVVGSGLTPLFPLPQVSVIIPVRNRPEEIRSCLTSLADLDYPGEKLEIFVIDDASEDETPQGVDDFPVTLHRMTERQGASACRNWGARHCQGDIICFLDSDCLADPAWLHELLPVFRRPEVGAAGGLVDSHDESTALDRYEKVKSALHMGTRSTDSAQGNAFFYLPSCNLAVRKDTFMEVGGFDENLEVGEDVDLCWRMIDAGWTVEYRSSAKILHKHRNRIWPFCKRRFEYGTSEPLLQSLHPERSKTFVLWPKALGFWILFVATLVSGNWTVGLAASAWILADTLMRHRRITKLAVHLHPLLAFGAVVRSNLSFLYHCCAFTSRYHLIWATALIPVFPLIGSLAWFFHLVVGTVEFLVRKPRLNLLVFLGLFSLEQLSYQAGVWFGCFRERFFLPLFPRISMRTVE
jgi:mycofactocin glycosyltransferase